MLDEIWTKSCKIKLPIEWMMSLSVSHKYESHGDSHVRLWWYDFKAYLTPLAYHRYGILQFIFETKPATSIEKEAVTFSAKSPIILHNNILAHTAQAVVHVLYSWSWEVLYHPPYSPDISPCEFDLIPKMKEPHHGIHFRTVSEIHQAVDRSIWTGAPSGIPWLPYWRDVKLWNRYLFETNSCHY